MRFPLWRRRRDDDLEEEIQGHLQMAIRERMERGETAEEAKHNALREFGNIGVIKEVTRDMWSWTALERMMQDLRYGVRILLKNPGFTLVVIVTLALGIGANVTLFSVVDAVVFRPLPFAEPSRLMTLWEENIPLFLVLKQKLGSLPRTSGRFEVSAPTRQSSADRLPSAARATKLSA